MTFNLTPDEVNLIGIALGNMPFSQVVALINNLQQQVKKQEKSEGVDS